MEPALAAAVKDALAVYYYPGTWDWPHELTQSLVRKALRRSLHGRGEPGLLETATAILDCYDAWASTVDDFAPIRIDHDVQGMVPDRHDADRGLASSDGTPVIYTARVDLLAVDAADEYWVVRHQFTDEWLDIDALLRDEEAVAACWAWEQDYMGMDIAGTIHNEMRITGPLELPDGGPSADDLPKTVAQHEPSGGGRSIPQHRRIYARASEPVLGERIEQRTAGILRRTRVRRSRDEIFSVGAQLADEALDMLDGPAVYPNPGEHCRSCEFSAPCLAMMAHTDAERLLANGFRRHPGEWERKPRLGQATWGFGRGAAPPQW